MATTSSKSWLEFTASTGKRDAMDDPYLTLVELVDRFRAGDAAAGDELVRTYEPHLRRAISRRLDNRRLCRRIDPDDIFQSVFREFFTALRSGEFTPVDDAQVKNELALLVGHKVTGQYRRHMSARRDIRCEDMRAADELELLDSQPGPAETVEYEDLQAAVLEGLRPAERPLLVHRLVGRSWPEIAARIGGQADTLRVRLKRVPREILRILGLTSPDRRSAR